MNRERRTFHGARLALFCLAIAGCEPGNACPNEADCPKDAVCRCDAKGQVIKETRHKAKGQDTKTFKRNERGSVVHEVWDLGDDGRVEREITYLYDAEGNRTGKDGYQVKCGYKEKLEWKCQYETPCPPPHDECSKCTSKESLKEMISRSPPCK